MEIQTTKEQIQRIQEIDNLVDLEQNLKSNNKPFRFLNYMALLTYKSHICKSDYIKWFNTITQNNCDFIRLAHENVQSDSPIFNLYRHRY